MLPQQDSRSIRKIYHKSIKITGKNSADYLPNAFL